MRVILLLWYSVDMLAIDHAGGCDLALVHKVGPCKQRSTCKQESTSASNELYLRVLVLYSEHLLTRSALWCRACYCV